MPALLPFAILRTIALLVYRTIDVEALLVPELRRRLNPAERELLGRRVLERVGQLEGRPRPGW